MRIRSWGMLAVSLALTTVSGPGALGAISSNLGFSFTFTANGVPNTVNWNDNGFNNFSIVNGRLVTPSGATDAYDGGAMIDICSTSGCAYNATMTRYTGTGSAASSTLYQGATQSIQGLTVTASYKFSETSASFRMLVQLENPTGSPITRTVRFMNWLGCDDVCYLRYHSNAGATQGTYFNGGSTPFSTDSYWTITADNPVSDAITSFAYGSPGGTVRPTTTITNEQNPNLYTIVDVTIPAYSTRYLVFLGGLGGVTKATNTLADAYAGVSTKFDSWSHIPTDIKSDLTSTQLSQILNWDTTLPSSSVELSLAGGAKAAVKGNVTVITASVSQAGRVDFFWNEKKIPGCINKSAVTSTTCNWKPSVTGVWNLKATLQPTDTSFGVSNSNNFQVLVTNRTGNR